MPDDWDPRPAEVIATEEHLRQDGAVKIVSLWASDPYIVGVLADGRACLLEITCGPTEVTYTELPSLDEREEL